MPRKSREIKADVVQRYRRGEKTGAIVRECGMSTHTLYRILHEHNVTLRGSGKPRSRKIISEYIAKHMRERHLTYVQVADICDISERYIRFVLIGDRIMTPSCALRLGRGLGLDSDRIYAECEKWREENRNAG